MYGAMRLYESLLSNKSSCRHADAGNRCAGGRSVLWIASLAERRGVVLADAGAIRYGNFNLHQRKAKKEEEEEENQLDHHQFSHHP